MERPIESSFFTGQRNTEIDADFNDVRTSFESKENSINPIILISQCTLTQHLKSRKYVKFSQDRSSSRNEESSKLLEVA